MAITTETSFQTSDNRVFTVEEAAQAHQLGLDQKLHFEESEAAFTRAIESALADKPRHEDEEKVEGKIFAVLTQQLRNPRLKSRTTQGFVLTEILKAQGGAYWLVSLIAQIAEHKFGKAAKDFAPMKDREASVPSEAAFARSSEVAE